jgi:Retroviral aspartyl protease
METIFPLKSRNYKVSAAVGVSTAVLYPVRAILDTGAGPNLIRANILPDDWERHRVLGEPTLIIVGAGGRRLRQKGTVTMIVELGRLQIKSRFFVTEGLAADCILGCLFINKHVTAILPKEKKVRLSDASVIPSLRDSDPLQPRLEKEPRMESPSTKIRVVKFTTVPSMSESLVWVQRSSGTPVPAISGQTPRRIGYLHGEWLADILPLQPFPIKVLNTSTRDRVIPKGMLLGHALPHPKGIIALTSEEPPPVTERPDVDGELWKEELELAHLLPQQRETVFQLLSKYRKMWDGRLGRVNSTTHRIDLVPGAKPVHSQPYPAGHSAREAESAEVQRILKAGVIEPASSEWASPVVLVPKPDGTLRFCVTTEN